MSTQVLPLPDAAEREAWLQERKTFLGATDIVSILGMSPYKTPLQVYLEKTGRLEPEPMSAPALRGIRMEPVVAQMYSDETGHSLRKGATVRMLDRPYLAATPDYYSPLSLVEIKTHSPRLAHEYGPPGTDELPSREVVQVTWQMHVCQAASCDLACLFGVDDLRIYTVGYDRELGCSLEQTAEAFWHDVIQADEPPVASAGDEDVLKRLYPSDAGAEVMSDAELEEVIEEMSLTLQRLRATEEALEGQKARIQQFMGSAAVLHCRHGAFTWKARKGSPSWKRIAEELGAPPALIAKHTPATGPRVFSTPWSRERKGA